MAKQLIDKHTNWGGLNLKEESLGKDLAGKVREHPELLDKVMDKLDDSDRDDVAQNTCKNLSDDDLRQLASTEEGRKALERMRGELTSDVKPSATTDQGYMCDDEVKQAQRIERAQRLAQGGTETQAPMPPGIPEAPPGASVDDNIKEASDHKYNPKWFYAKVRNEGDWDYKQKGAEYADYGNFNYGATCVANGFSEEQCLSEAGRAQIQAGTSDPSYGTPGERGNPFSEGTGSHGDDPRDQEMIKRGMQYYREHYGG